MATEPQAHRFTFGVFELDVRAGELRKRGARVRLQGQPLQILTTLLEQAGEVVSREELRQLLWPKDTFVEFDHSLNTAIKRLREALGDDASTPRFVETVPRRGYRFIAPVERFGDEAIPAGGTTDHAAARWAPAEQQVVQAVPVVPKGRRVLAAVFAVALLGALSGLGLWWLWSRSPVAAGEPAQVRLAVLPFANLTGDGGRDYVSEGLTEEVVAQLGRLVPDRLAVIGRSSTTWVAGPRPPLPEIARTLNVQYVIEGSVRNTGDRYRVAVRLVETENLTTLWSEMFEGPILDLVTVERNVSLQVARHLALELASDDPAALARATTSSSPAFEAYLRGVSLLAGGPDGFVESARLFGKAIDHDPGYALAYAGLSEAYLRQQDYYLVAPEQVLEPARVAALKALALDERLAEAHCALGDVLSATGHMPEAGREFTRALALNPSHAATYNRYAWHLVRVGRQKEAQALIARARALAPRSAEIATTAAYMDLASGRLDSASELSRAALGFEPDFPFARYVLGQVAMRRGAPMTAVGEFARARIAAGGAPKYVAALTLAYLAAGRPDEARRMVGELRAVARTRYVPPDMISQLEERLRIKG